MTLLAKLDEQAERAVTALELCQRERDKVRAERDAAIAKVAELQTRMAAMFVVMSQRPDTKASELDALVDAWIDGHKLVA